MLFGAFGIALVTIGWEAIKFFIARYDERKKSDPKKFKSRQDDLEILFNDLLHAGVDIQANLEMLCENTRASRATLYKLQNGGGVPQLGTIQTISILNESIREDLLGTVHPLKQEIQNFIIDGSYQKTLSKILSGDIIPATVSGLEIGQIKTFHEGLGNKQICLFLVTHIPELTNDSNKGFMIFAVLEFHENSVIDSKVIMECQLMKEKVRNKFDEFYIKRSSLLR